MCNVQLKNQRWDFTLNADIFFIGFSDYFSDFFLEVKNTATAETSPSITAMKGTVSPVFTVLLLGTVLVCEVV